MTEELPPLSDPSAPAKRSLGAAVATGLILVAVIVTAIILGKTAFFYLAATVVSLALWELMDALTRVGRRPATYVALLGGATIMALAFLERPTLVAVAIAFTALATMLWSLLPGRGEHPASDAGWTLLGVLWISGGGAAAVSLLTLSDEDGVLLLLSLILVVAVDDIFAYIGGTNLGRHKLAPSISPGKSWEGVLVGTAVALTMGAVVGFIMFDMSVWDGLALGAIASVFNPVGDLFESMAKREIGIKDSGRLLPGHGGMLDRLDAIIMCAPGFFLYLRLVVY